MPVTIRFANDVGDVLISAPMDGEPRLPFDKSASIFQLQSEFNLPYDA